MEASSKVPLAQPTSLTILGAVRNGVLEESHELVKLTNLPTFTTAMGKGGLDEAIPQFAGVHSGAGTLPAVKEALESVDTVIWIGNYPSDFNTGEFTTVVNKDAIVIDLQRFAVSIGKIQYPVSMKHVCIAYSHFWQSQLTLSDSATPRQFSSFEPNFHGFATHNLGSISKVQLSGQRRPEARFPLGRRSLRCIF